MEFVLEKIKTKLFGPTNEHPKTPPDYYSVGFSHISHP